MSIQGVQTRERTTNLKMYIITLKNMIKVHFLTILVFDRSIFRGAYGSGLKLDGMFISPFQVWHSSPKRSKWLCEYPNIENISTYRWLDGWMDR